MVQSSPPKQLSISMYKYLRSLNVLNNFTIKPQFASYMISFSDMMCCCWRVSTICAFFICFNANERELSEWICTNSTRPKPPTPRVARTRKSESWTSRNSSLILDGEWRKRNDLIKHTCNKGQMKWNAGVAVYIAGQRSLLWLAAQIIISKIEMVNIFFKSDVVVLYTHPIHYLSLSLWH